MSTAFGSRKTFLFFSLCFFSLYLIQEAIWTAARQLTHHLTLSRSCRSTFTLLVSQPGRKILTPCGEGPAMDGTAGTAALKATDTEYTASTAWSTSKTQQGSKTLSFCFVAQVVSWNARKKPCEASLQLASRTFGRSTDRRGGNEWTKEDPEVKRYGPRLWLWWLWAMKVSYYYYRY